MQGFAPAQQVLPGAPPAGALSLIAGNRRPSQAAREPTPKRLQAVAQLDRLLFSLGLSSFGHPTLVPLTVSLPGPIS